MDLKAKKRSCLPCSEEHVPFCEFMGYEYMDNENGFLWYYVPSNQICRFLINFESWQEGTFDKEKFLSNLKK